MDSSAFPAARLSEVSRIHFAVKALTGAATATDRAAEHDISRNFVCLQARKASAALTEVFSSNAPDSWVLFTLPVTWSLLRQLALGLTLICHSSYRGVAEFMRDLLGVRISEGAVHNIHQATAQQRNRPVPSIVISIFRLSKSACATKYFRLPTCADQDSLHWLTLLDLGPLQPQRV